MTGAAPAEKVPTEERVFWVEYLPAEQKALIPSFRQRLTEIGALGVAGAGTSDTDLARFLMARKWDLAKAADMYAKMVKWRTDFGADKVLHTFQFPQYEQIARIYPMFYCGTDRFGRPIYVESLGKINFTEILKLCDIDTFLRFHVWGWEYLVKHRFPAASKVAGRQIYSSCTFLDLAGVSFSQFPQVQSLIKTISAIDQDNYPEHLGNMFILNAGYTFSAIWACIKPWLDPRTQDKIKLCTYLADEQVWEIVDPAVLPQFLGGQKKLTLEECMQMDEGPWRDPKVLGSLYAEGKGLRASELAFQMVPLPQVPEQSN